MQATTSGKQIHEKYGKMLGFSRRMVPSPSNLIGMLLGRSGRGKSHFMLSCPGAYIINCDLSSTPGITEPKAVIWPGVTSDGRIVEPSSSSPDNPESGQPVDLTWDAILEKVDLLKQMAEDKYPGRPRLVVLDTLDRAIPILQRHVLSKAATRLQSKGRAVAWGSLYGPDAWDEVYNSLVNIALDVRSAGYGFYYLSHLTDRMVDSGKVDADGNPVRVLARNKMSITDNFRGRLVPICELIGVIDIKLEKVSSVKDVIDPITKKKIKEKVITEEVLKRRMSFSTLEFDDVTKRRVNLPDEIILPAENGWEAFERAYIEAAETGALVEKDRTKE